MGLGTLNAQDPLRIGPIRLSPICCRYLVDVDSWMEKFWWFLIVITGFALASFLIYRAVVEWEDHPILTTVDSSSVPITSIQFPTITICPKRRGDSKVYFISGLRELF